MLVDIGCNTGDFAQLALESGAEYVVGLEQDLGALERAYGRAILLRDRFLPLHQDLVDPSPNLGLLGKERPALAQRLASADGLLALAVLHHMAIRRNVPLWQALDVILAVAPTGVIEFVPKDDPTIKKMLALRDDIFPDYTRDNFLNALSARASVVTSDVITERGRELFWYKRKI